MSDNHIELVHYSGRVDFWNCVTHIAGALFGVAALALMLLKASNIREAVACSVYGFSIIAVYTVSAVYHGLKNSEYKRIARRIDHSTVPVLIAGTATPCALITLFRVSVAHSIFVFCVAWLCTFFGVFSKLCFFEKLKKVTMAVYIISCLSMLASVVPLIGEIDGGAFMKLVYGCVFYLFGAVFCGLGKSREVLHTVFHLLVLTGSVFHFYVIYSFVL